MDKLTSTKMIFLVEAANIALQGIGAERFREACGTFGIEKLTEARAILMEEIKARRSR